MPWESSSDLIGPRRPNLRVGDHVVLTPLPDRWDDLWGRHPDLRSVSGRVIAARALRSGEQRVTVAYGDERLVDVPGECFVRIDAS